MKNLVVIEQHPSVAYPLPGGSFEIPGLHGRTVLAVTILELHKERRTADLLVVLEVPDDRA